MSRNRALLMVAWTSLALVSVVQFRQSETGPDDAGDGATEAATAPLELAATTGETVSDPGTGPRPGGAGAEGRPRSRSTSTVVPTVGRDQAPRPALVATVVGDGVASLDRPGDEHPIHWFPNPTQFGGPRTFLVTDHASSPDHVKVSLPVMPNGQEGWIPRSAVTLSTVTHRATVDLSERTVEVWHGDELLVSTPAVTGRAAAPTPIGVFYVRDIVAQSDPDGAYGPWILALSGFSETLETFAGGLPALALHGTDEPHVVGSAQSSGCVRVPNEIISMLAETVPLGTPVSIVA